MEKMKSSRRRKPQRVGGKAVAAAGASMAATESPAVNANAVPGAPSEAKNSKFNLESSLQIKDVEDIHRRLMAMLADRAAVTVDIGRVGAVDTAGVQLLMAFQSEAIRRGVSVEYCGESAALTHALTVLGLGTAIRIVNAHD